jgi:putative SOS response-associated peptidase YedK
MCGRTGQAISPAVIERRWEAAVPSTYEPRYNVAPREPLAVVPNDDADTVATPEWGLLPEWVDEPTNWHFPINARAETVAEQPAFRDAFRERPCLVLSSGYYEWAGERRSAQPYRICRQDGEPFVMAGIWAAHENGPRQGSVAVLTCEANAVVEPIHDRMPVILARSEEKRWLRGGPKGRRELLDTPEGSAFEAHPISSAINDPSTEGPELIDPLDHEQGDLGAFGA